MSDKPDTSSDNLRNPPSRTWRSNDNYDLHRGYAYKDVKGRWRSPDGTRWVSNRSATTLNRSRLQTLRVADLQVATEKQGVRLTKPQAVAAVREAKGRPRQSQRDAILDFVADHYDVDVADLYDDYYDGDTP